MCKFIGKELHGNAPAARGSNEVGFTQFLTHKSTRLSIVMASGYMVNFWLVPNETDIIFQGNRHCTEIQLVI